MYPVPTVWQKKITLTLLYTYLIKLQHKERNKKKLLFVHVIQEFVRCFFARSLISNHLQFSAWRNLDFYKLQMINFDLYERSWSSTRRSRCFWLKILSLWLAFNRWIYPLKLENLKWWPFWTKILEEISTFYQYLQLLEASDC